jgi:hypothetical protein
MSPQVAVCEKQYVATEPGTVLPDGCVDNESQVNAPAAAVRQVAQNVRKLRKVASRKRARRVAGRNTRKAYAASGKARTAVRKRQPATAAAKRERRASTDAGSMMRKGSNVLVGHAIHGAVHARIDP